MMSPISISENELVRIGENTRRDFGVKTDCVEEYEVAGQADTTKFHIINDGLQTKRSRRYLLHTPYSQMAGDDQSIIGETFQQYNLATAFELVKLMLDQKDLRRPGTKLVVIYPLRASPGYMFGQALRRFLPESEIHEVYLRPRYTYKSFREHGEQEALPKKVIEIYYEDDYIEFPEDSNLLMAFVDSIASNRTAIASMLRVADIAINKFGNVIDNVAYVGWQAASGVEEVERFTSDKLGIESSFYSYEAATSRSSNKYDMPLYGLDEYEFGESRTKVRLGAETTIPWDVLLKHLRVFVPGADLLGDISNKNPELYTTRTEKEPPEVMKKANIEHLENTIKMDQSLQKISLDEPWFLPNFHGQIFERQLWSLNRRLDQLRIPPVNVK